MHLQQRHSADWIRSLGVKVGKTKIEDVIKPLLYYFAAIFIVLLLVTYIPAISLWLPGLLGYVK